MIATLANVTTNSLVMGHLNNQNPFLISYTRSKNEKVVFGIYELGSYYRS